MMFISLNCLPWQEDLSICPLLASICISLQYAAEIECEETMEWFLQDGG